MARAPARATTIREEPVAPKQAHGKTRLRKNASARSMLDLPQDIIDVVKHQYGQDLQWVTDSVHGKAEAAMRQSFEINAWEPVTTDMWNNLFDGMYTRKGHKGEIEYGGLVLMYRPLELSDEAAQEERSARDGALEAQRSMITNGVIPGMAASSYNPHNQKAIAGSSLVRKITPPMDIPTD